jgi:ketosteroid isomerase-like protein
VPRNKRLIAFALMGAVAALPAAASAQPAASAPATAEERAIRQVIADMESAWNRGDFRGYMAGFLRPGVIFVSRGRFQRDWQGTLDHYVRDYGASPETRGRLRFYDIRVEMLSADAAQLIGRFHLAAATPQYGINTRLMRKVNSHWVIALNHVSASETPD